MANLPFALGVGITRARLSIEYRLLLKLIHFQPLSRAANQPQIVELPNALIASCNLLPHRSRGGQAWQQAQADAVL
jgi:hypothetical protein